ncbi:MAG: helix-turn-helix transcriptional regulator [Patescibacteria group bacterium]
MVLGRPVSSSGQRIAAWRRIRGLTIRELADAAGLYYSSLSRMEKGHQEPRTAETEQIAAALGLTMAQFYGNAAERDAS